MRTESTRRIKIALCLLFTWPLAACTSTGTAKITVRTECPPACGLEISLPSDQRTPPEVAPGQKEIHVRHGALIAVSLKDHRKQPAEAATKLVFKGDTPFVDSRRKLLNEIILSPEKATLLQVRSDLPKCSRKDQKDKKDECNKDGYRFKFKYNIENHGNGRRPIRDPWIIIER